jgi:hypothetical protein
LQHVLIELQRSRVVVDEEDFPIHETGPSFIMFLRSCSAAPPSQTGIELGMHEFRISCLRRNSSTLEVALASRLVHLAARKPAR